MADVSNIPLPALSEYPPIDGLHVDLLLSRIARLAEACDDGVLIHSDCNGEVLKAFHEGGAKAYRNAIKLVIEYQRLSRARARESEQKES